MTVNEIQESSSKKGRIGASPSDLLRRIPAVDQLLAGPALASALAEHPRPEVVRAVRAQLDMLRAAGRRGALNGADMEAEAIGSAVDARLARRAQAYYRAVINATGVVLHTGLGRAPLAAEAVAAVSATAAVAAVSATAAGAQRLELDLVSGERGGRDTGCAQLLCELTGCEAATVVNNNAGATLLTLAALARGKKVVLSRGEMVEIGGSYRVPEILRESGALLAEVGTTNRTHLADYAAAIDDDTGLLLKVHTSNYRIRGFTAEVEVAELVELGKRFDLPVAHDLGSGSLLDLSPHGWPGEPSVTHSVKAGADLICFSGDKLLGGPQAGILVGKAAAIERCRRHPLFRALRPGRMIYAALEATLRLYLTEEAETLRRVPVLARLTASPEELEERARGLAARLRSMASKGLEVTVVKSEAQAGSGSLPDAKVASWAVRLTAKDRSARQLAAQLRSGQPAVIGRLHDGCLLLDLRSLALEEIEPLAEAVVTAFGQQWVAH